MKVSLINLEDTDLYWPKVEHFLAKAAEYTYGRCTAKDIYNTIINGSSGLWVIHKEDKPIGALITNIAKYPHKTLLNIQFCGGINFKNWYKLALVRLRQYAKEHKCVGIEVTGRAGWAKMLKNDGHKLLWSTFELPL